MTTNGIELVIEDPPILTPSPSQIIPTSPQQTPPPSPTSAPTNTGFYEGQFAINVGVCTIAFGFFGLLLELMSCYRDKNQRHSYLATRIPGITVAAFVLFLTVLSAFRLGRIYKSAVEDPSSLYMVKKMKKRMYLLMCLGPAVLMSEILFSLVALRIIVWVILVGIFGISEVTRYRYFG